MLSPRGHLGIFVYVNLVSWMLLLVIRLVAFLGYSNSEVFDVNFYLKGLLLNFFLLYVFFYFNARQEKMEDPSFVDILSNLFIFGLITTAVSIILQLIVSFLETEPVSAWAGLAINILYHINIILLTAFLTQAFFYWKKMVFHQKSESVSKTWNLFEYVLLISLLFNFFEFDLRHFPFSISLSILLVLGLVLSVNLRWVAYLSAKEKWQSILLLLFISLFAYYFFLTVINHSNHPYFTTDLTHSVYILAVFVFVIFYSIFSLLVIIFNLPTTSVFEKKMEEVMSFQRLTESLQIGEKEDHVYEVLLDNAIQSVKADAAWIEVKDESGRQIALVNRNISQESIKGLKRISRKKRLNQVVSNTFSRNKESKKENIENIETEEFESIFNAPLIINNRSLGTLTLLKKGVDGFEEEKKELIQTFVRQASLAIDNYRLLRKTIESERFKEEIKIAQRIQKSLLPSDLKVNDCIDIEAFSESAYEVGGDYYDIFCRDDGQIILVVGDVSGKGINAAFYMAQMKGIFQGLAQLNFPSEQFLFYANQALSKCLSHNSFITLTIAQINVNEQTIEFARAGHCPTLYYSAQDQKANYFTGEGLGLGIMRNPSFANFVKPLKKTFSSGDVVILYTDGILEALNPDGEQYGYENLQNLLELTAELSSKSISDKLVTDLKAFGRGNNPDDDYTALIIKFKAPVVDSPITNFKPIEPLKSSSINSLSINVRDEL
jgi:serine phosphatase RsbU (regulator of sigma subunit)